MVCCVMCVVCALCVLCVRVQAKTSHRPSAMASSSAADDAVDGASVVDGMDVEAEMEACDGWAGSSSSSSSSSSSMSM